MKRFILTEDDRAHIKDLYELEQPGPVGPSTTDKPECRVGETGTLVQIQNVIGLSDPSKGGLFCKLPITRLGTGGAKPSTQPAPVTPQPAPSQTQPGPVPQPATSQTQPGPVPQPQ